MIIRNLKATALALSLVALSSNTEAFAESSHHHHSSSDSSSSSHEEGVRAAQAIYQDETPFSPVTNQPIPFSVKDFRTNVDVNSNKTIFEVEIAGLYSLDAFLLINVPTVGDSVAGYITINGRRLLPFYSRETSTLTPVVELHFNDRLVYLEKGDKISVVLSEFVPGTSVLSRGLVIVALNNSR